MASEAFRTDEPTELTIPGDAEYIGSMLDTSIESARGQAARMLGLAKKPVPPGLADDEIA